MSEFEVAAMLPLASVCTAADGTTTAVARCNGRRLELRMSPRLGSLAYSLESSQRTESGSSTANSEQLAQRLAHWLWTGNACLLHEPDELPRFSPH